MGTPKPSPGAFHQKTGSRCFSQKAAPALRAAHGSVLGSNRQRPAVPGSAPASAAHPRGARNAYRGMRKKQSPHRSGRCRPGRKGGGGVLGKKKMGIAGRGGWRKRWAAPPPPPPAPPLRRYTRLPAPPLGRAGARARTWRCGAAGGDRLQPVYKGLGENGTTAAAAAGSGRAGSRPEARRGPPPPPPLLLLSLAATEARLPGCRPWAALSPAAAPSAAR